MPIPKRHSKSAAAQPHRRLGAHSTPTPTFSLTHAALLSRLSVQSIITGTGALRSDASVDPQLLIKLSFREPVKLRGFKLLSTATTASTASASVQSENPDGHTESAPRTLKLFVNAPNLSFADADSTAATETIVLQAGDVGGEREVKLKFVKYQNVTGLTVLVEDNVDDSDVTVINRLDLIGATIAGMNVNELKKVEDH